MVNEPSVFKPSRFDCSLLCAEFIKSVLMLNDQNKYDPGHSKKHVYHVPIVKTQILFVFSVNAQVCVSLHYSFFWFFFFPLAHLIYFVL